MRRKYSLIGVSSENPKLVTNAVVRAVGVSGYMAPCAATRRDLMPGQYYGKCPRVTVIYRLDLHDLQNASSGYELNIPAMAGFERR